LKDAKALLDDPTLYVEREGNLTQDAVGCGRSSAPEIIESVGELVRRAQTGSSASSSRASPWRSAASSNPTTAASNGSEFHCSEPKFIRLN
jgi:hypothetical protein